MNRFLKTLIFLSLITLTLGLGANEAEAGARITNNLTCSDGVVPQNDIVMDRWSDYASFGSIKTFELRRLEDDGVNWSGLQYSNFPVLATYDFNGGATRTYVENDIENDVKYKYRLVGYGYNGEVKVFNYWDNESRCGIPVSVSTNLGAPWNDNVNWTVSSGGESRSGSGSQTVYVTGGKTYTISFTGGRDGYALAYISVGITSNGGATTYHSKFGTHTFDASSSYWGVGINAIFQVNNPVIDAPVVKQRCVGRTTAFISWSPMPGAVGYKITDGPRIVGYNWNTDVTKLIASSDGAHSYAVEGFNSLDFKSKNSVGKTPERDKSFDCSYTVNVTANSDSGSWVARTKLYTTFLADSSGSGTSWTAKRVGEDIDANVYMSSYITFTPNSGKKLVSVNGITSRTGQSISNGALFNIGWGAAPWALPGHTHNYDLVWQDNPPGTHHASASCNGTSPQVTVTWNYLWGDGPSVLERARGNPVGSISRYYGGVSQVYPSTRVYDTFVDTNVQENRYYSYYLERNGLAGPAGSVYVPSCYVAPTTGTLNIISNLDSANWQVKKSNSVVGSGAGDDSISLDINGNSENFIIVPDIVSNYISVVSEYPNSFPYASNEVSLSVGGEKNVYITYGPILMSEVTCVSSGGPSLYWFSREDMTTIDHDIVVTPIGPDPNNTATSENLRLAYDSNGVTTPFGNTGNWRSYFNTNILNPAQWENAKRPNGAYPWQFTLTFSGGEYPDSSIVWDPNAASGNSCGGTIDINANPNPVDYGNNTLVNWVGDRVSMCSASGDWTGLKGVTDSVWFNNVTSGLNLVITCSAQNGTLVSDSVQVAVAGGPPQCNDEIDNDNDGAIDHAGFNGAPADPDCSDANDNDESGSFGIYQCSDLIDNDGDGDIDFPADKQCGSLTDTPEAGPAVPPRPQCDDGDDNDSNGQTDHPADSNCSSIIDDIEGPDPEAFSLEIVGKLEIDSPSGTGTSTSVSLRVVPINGFDSDVILSYGGVSPQAISGVGHMFGDNVLSESEYSQGSTFEVFVPTKPSLKNYQFTVRAIELINGAPSGLLVERDVLLEIDSVSFLFFEEF